MIAFILFVAHITWMSASGTQGERGEGEEEGTHSMSAKRYPMHARGPPRKERRWPHTPGMFEISSGGFSHRSGLSCTDEVGEIGREQSEQWRKSLT